MSQPSVLVHVAQRLYWMMWFSGAFAGGGMGLYVLHKRHVLGWKTFLAQSMACVGLWVGAKLQHRLEYFSVADALNISLADLAASPGMRLPLGLALGGALAGITCLVLRAPWRETGDALATAASTMIPIGRIGCFMNGCCMGTTCGIWAPFCVRYGPGTESYDRQVVQGLLAAGSPLSLPAHPLPLYYGVASAITLVVLLLMLHRGAAPGAMLAVFCIVRPATKLSLEGLRVAIPEGPHGLMLAIPLTVLTVTCTVLALRALRARRPSAYVAERS